MFVLGNYYILQKVGGTKDSPSPRLKKVWETIPPSSYAHGSYCSLMYKSTEHIYYVTSRPAKLNNNLLIWS